jgi:Prolyl oligopeptidase family
MNINDSAAANVANGPGVRRPRLSNHQCAKVIGASRTTLHRCKMLGILATLSLYLTARFIGAALAHDVTLADSLRVEAIGRVAVDPTGSRVAFERIPGYGSRVSYGVEITEARYSGELYVVDLKKGSGPSRLVDREHMPFEGMWMAGFSPKGSRLAVVWLDDGAIRMGAYDFEKNVLVKFPFTPDLGFFPLPALEPVWLSEEELIMAALPPGQQPIMTGMRQAAARALANEWEEAWRGKSPTSSILRSYAGMPPHTPQLGSLLRINARTAEVGQLAEGRFLDLSLSANKRFLAASRIGERRQYSPTEMQDGNNGLVGFYRHEAVVFDLGGPQLPESLCPGLDVGDGSLTWSAKGNALSFFAWPEGSPRNRGIFYLVDATHRHCRAMPHVGLDVVSASFRVPPHLAVPFAGALALPARRAIDVKANPTFTESYNDPRRSDWYWLGPNGVWRSLTSKLNDVSTTLVAVAPQALFIQASGKLWRITPRDSPVDLTASTEEAVEKAYRVQDSIVLEFSGGRRGAWILDIPSGHLRQRIDLAQYRGPIEAIAAQSGAVVLDEKDNTASRLTAVLPGGQRSVLWTYNAHLADVCMPRRVMLHYTIPDGKEMHAAAFLPNALAPGRRAPTIVNIYPGLQSHDEWDVPSPYDVQLYTSLGYIVLFPDAPEDLLRTADDNPLGGWSNLVVPALDALIEQGVADKKWFVASGTSQGSWSVLALISQTRRFKAAISSFGAANFISAYGALPMLIRLWPNDLLAAGDSYRFERGYPSFGAPPWDNPQGYVLASPLFSVRQISTPLLLIKSDFDAVGPMEEFDQMFSAMLRLRKEAQYVRYWGEGHGNSSPANIRDQWSRELAWFDQYLDISRDSGGHIIYDGNMPKSRGAAPAWTPDDFLKQIWFFGPPPDQTNNAAGDMHTSFSH